MSTLPTTWDLTPLLQSDIDPRIPLLEEDLKKAVAQFVEKWSARQDYLENLEVLRQALDDFETLMRAHGTSGALGYYFSLRSAQDQNNPQVKAGEQRIEELEAKLSNELAFFELNLAKLSPEIVKKMTTSSELAPYHHFLERIAAEAPYKLSEPEEKILTTKAHLLHTNWRNLTSRLIASETYSVKGVAKTFEELMSLFEEKDKALRDEAAKGVNTILKKHLIVAETEINAILANKKSTDELRGMSRPDLGRHLADDMESEVIDGMLAAVESRFDLSQRYYALKAKLLGMEKLGYHDRNVEYGKLTTKYAYEEAVALVASTFAKLDSEFAAIFSDFTTSGAVDVFPAQGKRGGAFCAYNLLDQPTYILLNHADSLNDVLTLAHEAGHGINDEFMRRAQHALYFNTPLATAEVASTFMEDFVLDAVAEKLEAEERLAVMMMKLNADISTIFRQVACYRFEQALHAEFREKQYLDAPAIGALFQKHMAAYMGDAVSLDEGSENWWVYWSHIRTFFYVYSYASGLLISKSMQAAVKKDAAYIEKVKAFLAAGSSESPRALFAGLGIDIAEAAFWQEGLGRVEELLNETEQLAKSLSLI